MKKPVIPIFTKFTENDFQLEENKIKIFRAFRDADIPVFGTMQDALYTLRAMLKWKKNSN